MHTVTSCAQMLITSGRFVGKIWFLTGHCTHPAPQKLCSPPCSPSICCKAALARAPPSCLLPPWFLQLCVTGSLIPHCSASSSSLSLYFDSSGGSTCSDGLRATCAKWLSAFTCCVLGPGLPLTAEEAELPFPLLGMRCCAQPLASGNASRSYVSVRLILWHFW